ncbi:hypothetical protein [Aureibacillus halotolerans]|uniref:Uncharacterized protein n=1 Tax=Aureibacillus halotolerans TaxID=1508390 RepID=A0A4R6TS34_9BACI|nr:hypothetical protein [Aureibacillus halotolerans]TDQ36081.1 hypothetical protein EV213_12012 [Aureibacillus halotolerans]
MFNDFMTIKELQGELKLSHKQRELGITLSTEELVVQKPHLNYHIKLEDIVSIRPFEAPKFNRVSVRTGTTEAREVATMAKNGDHYQFHIKRALVHRRSGKAEIGTTSIVVPMRAKYVKRIAAFSGMSGWLV